MDLHSSVRVAGLITLRQTGGWSVSVILSIKMIHKFENLSNVVSLVLITFMCGFNGVGNRQRMPTLLFYLKCLCSFWGKWSNNSMEKTQSFTPGACPNPCPIIPKLFPYAC